MELHLVRFADLFRLRAIEQGNEREFTLAPRLATSTCLIAGLLYLQHTFDRSFRVDSIANRNYCGCLSSVLSPVKVGVAPLVRVSRAIVEKIIASTENTGPRMLGQTGA